MTRPKWPFFRRVSDNTTKSNLIDHCKSPAQPAGHKSLQPGCKPRRQTSNGAVFGREEKLSKRSGCCLTFPHQVSTHVQIDFETHHPFRISCLVLRDLHEYLFFSFSIRNPTKPHLTPTAVDVGLGRLPSGHPGAIFLASFPPPKRRRQQINIGATISCHYGWGREGSSSV